MEIKNQYRSRSRSFGNKFRSRSWSRSRSSMLFHVSLIIFLLGLDVDLRLIHPCYGQFQNLTSTPSVTNLETTTMYWPTTEAPMMNTTSTRTLSPPPKNSTQGEYNVTVNPPRHDTGRGGLEHKVHNVGGWGLDLEGFGDFESQTKERTFKPNCYRAQEQCEVGWFLTPEERSCVTVSLTDSLRHEAAKSCKRRLLSGTFAIIPDKATNDFLLEFMNKRIIYGNKTAVFGLIRQDGVWQWPDGSVPTYTNWSPEAELDNPKWACAVLGQDGWRTISCENSSHHFICETPVIRKALGRPGAPRMIVQDDARFEIQTRTAHLPVEAHRHYSAHCRVRGWKMVDLVWVFYFGKPAWVSTIMSTSHLSRTVQIAPLTWICESETSFSLDIDVPPGTPHLRLACFLKSQVSENHNRSCDLDNHDCVYFEPLVLSDYEEPPTMTLTTKDPVKEGQSMTLDCSVPGNRNLMLTWAVRPRFHVIIADNTTSGNVSVKEYMEGGELHSELHIKSVTGRMDQMRVYCYKYNVSQYGVRLCEFNDDDNSTEKITLCAYSPLINVTRKVKVKDKTGLLASIALFLILIIVVMCLIGSSDLFDKDT